MDTRVRSGIDFAIVIRVVILLGAIVAAATTLYHNALSGQYGFDFRGIWQAAQTVTAGHNPYPAAHPNQLHHTGHPYVLPPLIALISIPLGHLSFTAAIVIWNAIAVAALVYALHLLGIRDVRVYLLALCSFPFVSSLALGQPDGVFALLAALAWRYRHAWKAGLAVGLLIAAKVLMWPLVLWLLFRRRFAGAVVSVATAAAITVGTWALIGFDGFTSYPALLSADARGFETDSHSVAALLIRLGTSRSAAMWLGILCAVLLVVALVRVSAARDITGFLAAIVAGLLVSPLMWSHYLVLIFVPLAVVKRRATLVWLLVAAFWISPTEPPAHAWQVAAVLFLFALIALTISRDARPEVSLVRRREPASAQWS